MIQTALTPVGTGAMTAQQGLTADIFTRYIDYLDAAPKTVDTYTKALKQLFTWFSLNGITQPTRQDLIAFKEDLQQTGHKPTTISAYITAARLFFAWTAQEQIYPNIAEHLKGAKLDREHKRDYLTTHQVKNILGGIDRTTETGLRDYAMLTAMITGGLRTVEVSRANIEDLRTLGDESVLFIQGKGRQERTDFVKISPEVEKALRAYLKTRPGAAASEPLFTSTSNNSKGERLSTRSISGIAKTRMQAAGYDSTRLTAHSLRHTAVTLALLAGEELESVQQFARHANIATTMIYNHALDKSKNHCGASIAAAIF